MRLSRRVAASALAVVVATAALATSGCSNQSGVARAEGDVAYVAGDGSTIILPQSERKPAPVVVAPTLKDGSFDGPTYDLAAQKGKVVVLNVWASWCAPCRAEAAALVSTSASLAPGAVFAGLNTRDSPTTAQAFVDRFRVPYPTLDDTDGRIQLSFRDSLPMTAIPTTVFIDKQGRVAARALGELDESRIKGIVEPLLRESAG